MLHLILCLLYKLLRSTIHNYSHLWFSFSVIESCYFQRKLVAKDEVIVSTKQSKPHFLTLLIELGKFLGATILSIRVRLRVRKMFLPRSLAFPPLPGTFSGVTHATADGLVLSLSALAPLWNQPSYIAGFGKVYLNRFEFCCFHYVGWLYLKIEVWKYFYYKTEKCL